MTRVILGQCFPWAWRYQLDHGGTLVHALVTHPWDRNLFPHAWVESRGRVYDWQTITMGKAPLGIREFYQIWKPERIERYTRDEAMRTMVKSKHYGPWGMTNPLGSVPFAILNKANAEVLRVPDTKDPARMNYWVDLGDSWLLYLEGWSDSCLAGTGFTKKSDLDASDDFESKIDYMKDLTSEVLPRKAREHQLVFYTGGFRRLHKRNLYGITWGIYRGQKWWK